MGRSWKCRIGWHDYVRRSGGNDPNLQICTRCHKKRDALGGWGRGGPTGMGGGGGS